MIKIVFYFGVIEVDLNGVIFVIILGDFVCVQKIVELMDNFVFFVSYCEYIVYCVELDGQFVVVCLTGIGGFLILIVVEELV